MTNRVFSVRSNAIRNARLQFGKSAKVGTEFSISEVEGGYSWAPLVEVPAVPPVTAAAAEAAPEVKRSKPARTKPVKPLKSKKAAKKFMGPLFRDKSKMLKLLKMISSQKGASLDSLVKALGWQKHTIRGRISTFKAGDDKHAPIKIKSYRDDNRGRVYQVA